MQSSRARTIWSPLPFYEEDRTRNRSLWAANDAKGTLVALKRAATQLTVRTARRVKLDSDGESAYTTEFLDGDKSTLRGAASRIERH